MLTHLHVHSSFSLLEGLAAPADLVRRARDHGLSALALTDHNRLSGAIEFYDACYAAGLKPLIGMRLDVSPPPDLGMYPAGPGCGLILLATNLDGWKSLCRLSSALHAEAPPLEQLPFDAFAPRTAGLLCLTGGRCGVAADWLQRNQVEAARRWLERLRGLFPGRLYAELQFHEPADRDWVQALAKLAGQLGLPAVATHSIYYLDPGEAELQRTITAIRVIRPRAELGPGDLPPPEACFLPPEALSAKFADYPAALANIDEIISRCQLELPLGKPHFPQLDLPPGQTAAQVLRLKAEAGARRYYAIEGGCPPVEVQERLDHELEVIAGAGFEALFLVMQEIVEFAHRSGIPIASRGSASSSLAAHCLGITTPDPVKLNLYFERFLNPSRSTPPDIDTDLCSRRREEVIDFVYRRFGTDRVATVCTISRFRRRSALRETAKAYRLPHPEINRLVDGMPHRFGPPWLGEDDEDPFTDLREKFRSSMHERIFADAAALRGLPRHLSVHPGGIVIAPGPLIDFLPTQLATKGVIITQFDLEGVARLGLVKIDLLGIRGLTVLGDVARLARQPERAGPTTSVHQAEPLKRGKTRRLAQPAFPSASPGHESPLVLLDNIPSDDATSDAVEHGRTIGCFQIESPGMRATLREIRARSEDDILAALALYRPGPLTGGLKDAFVARYRGQEQPAYPHPALQPLLNDTYGVILYQEQVLRIAHELGGLTLAEADLLRRAMSHFDPGKQMQTLKERFIAGAQAQHHIPPAVSEQIWEQMAAFAGYGFPKAHAASYARVAWQSAWCKVHFPAIFLAAVLANWGGYYSQRVYLMEARRQGLGLKPPLVNHALPEFSAQKIAGREVLVMGLGQVRELTRRTQQRIIQGRPFTSLIDFLARADPRPLEARNLARSGALEDFGPIPAQLRQIEQGGWRGGQLSLFDLPSQEEDWSLEQKVAAQEELLGTSIVAHPLELHAARLASAGAITTLEAAARIGKHVRVAGMRQTWRRSLTSRGEHIYFMSLEDLEGMLEVIIPAGVYRQGRSALSGPGPYIIDGVVEWDVERGEPYIRADRIEAQVVSSSSSIQESSGSRHS